MAAVINLLAVVIGIMAVVIIALLLKIILLKKSAKEIETAFADRLITDTNTLIDISSSDKNMKRLASSINAQLRKLREEHHRFVQGDTELKNAVTNISHDLRTPLTAIFGYLDLLEKQEKSEEVERYLKIIGERCESLKSLTEELFKYSVIVTTDEEFKTEEIVVNNVLEESVAGYYATLVEHSINPVIDLPEEKVACLANRSALNRIFSNLLNNAVKYSNGDLHISLKENGEIVFSNTALGLDEIQVGRLFDRFYTVESARKSTGLGLAISKTLAEQMNGSISAKYTDNRLIITLKLLKV
ncbi:MAG: HAMP domain-containing histidine kinase [Eubacterium sp.]|nr:HAMP domain-containing histidine kinase [Eubacterium sp.]